MEETYWKVITILVGMLTTALWFYISSTAKKMEILQQEMEEVKMNYLERFDKLKTEIYNSKIDIIREFSKLRIEILKNKNSDEKDSSV